MKTVLQSYLWLLPPIHFIVDIFIIQEVVKYIHLDSSQSVKRGLAQHKSTADFSFCLFQRIIAGWLAGSANNGLHTHAQNTDTCPK